jgi:hypothetical protein
MFFACLASDPIYLTPDFMHEQAQQAYCVLHSKPSCSSSRPIRKILLIVDKGINIYGLLFLLYAAHKSHTACASSSFFYVPLIYIQTTFSYAKITASIMVSKIILKSLLHIEDILQT